MMDTAASDTGFFSMLFRKPPKINMQEVAMPKLREHIQDIVKKNFPLYNLLRDVCSDGSICLQLRQLPLFWDEEGMQFYTFSTADLVEGWDWEKMDPYAVLGLPEDATDSELTKEYRKQVKKCHPDCETPNPEKFKIITEAYDKITKNKQEHAKPPSNAIPPAAIQIASTFAAKKRSEAMQMFMQSWVNYKPMHKYLKRRKKKGGMRVNLDLRIVWDRTIEAEIHKLEIEK